MPPGTKPADTDATHTHACQLVDAHPQTARTGEHVEWPIHLAKHACDVLAAEHALLDLAPLNWNKTKARDEVRALLQAAHGRKCISRRLRQAQHHCDGGGSFIGSRRMVHMCIPATPGTSSSVITAYPTLR